MTSLQLKDKLCADIKLYGKGKIDIDQLYASADAYIEALKQYKQCTGKKFRIPSRGYLIRAFR